MDDDLGLILRESMRHLWNSSLLPSVLLAMGFVSAPTPTRADVPSMGELRELLQQQWDSLATIEYTCEESPKVQAKPTRKSMAVMRFETAKAKGGKTAYRITNVSADAEPNVVTHLIENGKQRFEYTYFMHDSRSLSSLTIRNQEAVDSGIGKAPMSAMSWLLTPGAKPIHEYLDEKAELSETTTDGHRRINLTFPLNEYSVLKCVLDPEHDWLPISVEFLDDERTKWVVTEFQRDNGRWFPASGLATATILGHFTATDFTVKDLKINRPIGGSKFVPLKLAPGVLVTDKLKDRVEVWNGTNKTRDEYLKKHTKSVHQGYEDASPKDAESPLTASVGEDGPPWTGAMALLSVAALATAGGLAARSKSGFRGTR